MKTISECQQKKELAFIFSSKLRYDGTGSGCDCRERFKRVDGSGGSQLCNRVFPFHPKEANMGRTPCVLALCAVLAAASLGSAQSSTPSSSRPSQAEVRFGDGSIVRMSILQEDLEVQT